MLPGPKFWLLLLSLLAFLVDATRRGHSYERIWLWEAYQVAIALDGPKQGYILAFKRGGITNEGTGPDKTLTFREFNDVIDQRGPGKAEGYCTVDAPANNDETTLKQVAAELEKQKFNNILNTQILNSKIYQTAKKNQAAGLKKNPPIYTNPYVEFLDAITKMVEKASQDPTTKGRIGDRLKAMREVSKAVESIRGDELQDRIVQDIQKDTSKGGFGLKEADLVTETATNKYSDEELKRLNLPATLEKLGDDAVRDKLEKWVTKYGSDEWYSNGQDSLDSKKGNVFTTGLTHLQSRTIWKSIALRVNVLLGVCRT